jgi:hypothetical protein
VHDSPSRPSPVKPLNLNATPPPDNRVYTDPTMGPYGTSPQAYEDQQRRAEAQQRRDAQGAGFLTARDMGMTDQAFQEATDGISGKPHPGFWTPEFQNPVEFYAGRRTISRIDFLPSDQYDSIDVCTECMNDWAVRGNVTIVNIETIETEWPESTVFHRWRSLFHGQTTYFVRFLRVWYNTTGPPKYEQRFCKGRGKEPVEFPEQPRPEVNKDFAAKAALAGGLARDEHGAVKPGGGMVLRRDLTTASVVWWDYVWLCLHFAVLVVIAFFAVKSGLKL